MKNFIPSTPAEIESYLAVKGPPVIDTKKRSPTWVELLDEEIKKKTTGEKKPS